MKRIIVFLTTLLIFLCPFVSNGQAATKNFTDVSEQHWAFDDINWAVNEGLIKGYPDGTFKSSNLLTESQFVVVLTRYLDSKLTDNVLLKDQSAIQYTYLLDREIILPGHDTSAKKNAPISRIVMARALYEAVGGRGSDTDTEVIDWMYKNKLTTGKGVSTDKYVDFGGAENLYRVHVAAFFRRADEQNLIYKEVKEEINLSERMKEIQAKWNLLKPRYEGPLFAIEPSTTLPYSLGELQKAHLQDALNMTNFVRFLSYLPSNVRLNEQFNKEAQAASVVNGANQQLTHYPVQPKGMNEAIFDLGYSGASTSNIGLGYKDIVSSIQRGYMEDADDSNRDRVGHRRWILSPRLQEVGFGFALDANGRSHTAMKVIAPNMWDNPSASYEYIAWPSIEAFPTSFFGEKYPWSISLNEDLYDSFETDEIVVTLTRKNDQKTWEFSHHKQNDGYFNIDTGNYGNTPYTIIFQPNNIGSYREGDTYQVKVSGIYKMAGEKTTIQFETTFFNLVE